VRMSRPLNSSFGLVRGGSQFAGLVVVLYYVLYMQLPAETGLAEPNLSLNSPITFSPGLV
jgi:hypothetical protein